MRCVCFVYSVLAAISFVVAPAANAASAQDQSIQAACFAPQALKAVVGERQPQRGIHTFDKMPAADGDLAPFSPVPPALRGAIRRVDLPKGEKLIALTFDLCEQYGEVSGYDGDIFDYLRAEKIHATLFAGGKWMRSHAARTEQLLSDPLFEIANHSEAHRNLRLLDGAAVQADIIGPQRAYEAARKRLTEHQCTAPLSAAATASLPPRLTLFRFPYGACNAATLNAVNDAGLLAIQWDLSSGDPDPNFSAEVIAKELIRRAKPGSIIVAHGNGRGWNTAAALPLAIPKLKALGYQFVTVSELLARGTPVIADGCYDTRPGDTDRYDFPISLTAHAKSATGAVKGTQHASLKVVPAIKARRLARAARLANKSKAAAPHVAN
ncbi:MAG: polysaccharide deacetylase family protein [Hyphomicrobium sp.]